MKLLIWKISEIFKNCKFEFGAVQKLETHTEKSLENPYTIPTSGTKECQSFPPTENLKKFKSLDFVFLLF